MLYLGTSSTPDVRAAMADGRLGLMNTPDVAYDLEGFPDVTWAADNGRYSGRERWTADRWMGWLEANAAHASRCLFACAPDHLDWLPDGSCVGDALLTLEESAEWFDPIRSLGYRPAFVLQDGVTLATIPWQDIDALFVGGSTPFKFSPIVREVATWAHRLGVHVHVGRVNTLKRLRYCRDTLNADSVDGTVLRWPDANLEKLLGYLRQVETRQHPLELHP